MSMFAYRASQFMIAFNFAMVFINTMVAPLIFPDYQLSIVSAGDQYGTPSVSIGGYDLITLMNNPNFLSILALLLTAGGLALFAFSLIVPTIPIIAAFFFISMVFTQYWFALAPLNTLPFTILWTIRIMIFVTFMMGISQYSGRTNFSGS